MAELIDEKELLDWLKISPSTAWRWRKNGMPHYGGNRQIIRYDKDQVLKWLENQKNK